MISPRCCYSPHAVISLRSAQREVRDRLLSQIACGTIPLQQAPCLCGESGGRLLAQRDRWGLPVTTILCQRCALLRTSPRLPDSVLPSFYEHDYRLLMDGISTPTDAAFRLQLQRGAEALELLRALGRVGKGSRVYEVGCSAGGVLYPFLEAGCVVAGSDYDIRFLANARNLSIEVFEGDWENLRGLPAPDIVILSHVVEHLNDPVEFIRSVATLLKPSGCLFVAVPGLDSIAADYCGDLLRYLQICHTFHFTRRTLMHTLRRAGLTPIHADDSVLSVSMLTTSSVVLPEETEDPDKLFSRLESLERSFEIAEMRLHRRARRLAVGFKRLLSSRS